MKRLAVFAEGQTELKFVQRLIEEIAGRNRVAIEKRRIIGGASAPRQNIILEAATVDKSTEFFVLIVDCGGDHQVKARILEEHEGLTRIGYTHLIGIRDVRPDFTHSEIPALERGLRTYIKTSLAPVSFILAVLEIEAWFLAEASHFERIDTRISLPSIQAALGFNPAHDDPSVRAKPAEDLDACYALAGLRYKKGDDLTVEALDYAEVYCNLGSRVPSIARLSLLIDDFLRPDAP